MDEAHVKSLIQTHHYPPESPAPPLRPVLANRDCARVNDLFARQPCPTSRRVRAILAGQPAFIAFCKITNWTRIGRRFYKSHFVGQKRIGQVVDRGANLHFFIMEQEGVAGFRANELQFQKELQ